MAQTEDKFRKQLEVVKLKLDEIVEILASGNTEDISGTYKQIGELIKRLEKLKDTTADYLMETDKDLEYIKQWTMDHKEDISPFRKVRDQIRDRSLFMWGVGGGGNHGVGQAYFLREKGWAKREFHDDWGWVVCFVKNHTHYNSCGRSK